MDRGRLVRPLHHVLLCSHNDNYTQDQHNFTLISRCLITPLILCLSFSILSGLVSHCISILKVIYALLRTLNSAVITRFLTLKRLSADWLI